MNTYVNINIFFKFSLFQQVMEIATHDYDEDDEQQVSRLIALMDNGRNDEYRQSKTMHAAQVAAIKVGKLSKLINRS